MWVTGNAAQCCASRARAAPHSGRIRQECAVWWAELSLLRPAHLALLNADERSRRERYLQPADQDRFALAAVLLRLVAAWELGLAPDRVVVDRRCPRCPRPHGRPRLPGSDLHVSISHSGELVAVAATRAGPVGVDVEQVRDQDYARLVPAVLTAGEARAVTGAVDFLRCWTRKEAVLKATGDGITVPMNAVDVGPPGQPPRLRGYPGRTLAPSVLVDLAPADGYVAAVNVCAPSSLTRQYDAAPLLSLEQVRRVALTSVG